jgi:parvulin-like peptidyl-prolyl isomerase
VGRQRLALVVFGALFVLLFVIFAIAEGIGQPSVPAGDVAIVQSVPADIGTVTEAELKRTIIQQAATGGLKKAPAVGSTKYEELKSGALKELLNVIWIQGEAEERGISVTEKQIETKLQEIKKQEFKTEAAFQAFLKKSHFTKADVDARVKLQLLSEQVQEIVSKSAPPATSAEISDFYDAEKATQFTKKATRDIRLVINKNKAEVEKAKELLDKDNSPASWKKVAAKYSSDPTTKTKGGVQAGISEEVLQEPLKKEIFGAATGELIGPIAYQKNFLVLEVTKLNGEKIQSLSEARSQISTQLTQQLQQEFFTEFVTEYQSKWQSRTFCASGFKTEDCANFVGSGHPSTAPPTCYEAHPKGGPAKECPAPVTSISPALPGSITVVKPKGEPLPQRPRPEGLKEGATSIPVGGAPSGAPTGAPTGE